MHCERCGQNTDWIGGGSEWRRVGSEAAAIPLLECEVCGHQQRAR